jgi:hypothetical protein
MSGGERREMRNERHESPSLSSLISLLSSDFTSGSSINSVAGAIEGQIRSWFDAGSTLLIKEQACIHSPAPAASW